MELMDKNKYIDWYSNDSVLFEIVKQLSGRETTFMGWSEDKEKEYVFRCIKAHNLAYLRSNMNAFNFSSRFFNIYRSIASLQNMPMFSYNMKNRIEQQQDFNKEFNNYITGVDFVMDFDGDNVDYDTLWRQVKLIKNLFSDYGVPYIIKNSSNNGFHIEIPDKYFKGTPEEKIKCSLMFARSLKSLWDLTTIDLKIYGLRRIFKVAYTLDVKSGLVVTPLDDEQFHQIKEDFSPFLPENLLPSVKMRGMLERKVDMGKFVGLLDELEEPDLIDWLKTEDKVIIPNGPKQVSV